MAQFDFHPTAVGFDNVNALGLAQAAELAYASDDTIRRTIDIQWGFPKFRFFNKRGAQGYLAVNDTMMMLLFRGVTAGAIGPWVSEAQSALVPVEAGRMHKGLHAAFEAIWDEVLVSFRLLRNRNQPIFVAGHNIGGGLAVRAAQRLSVENLLPAGLYTFGAPRVGDAPFCDALRARLAGRMFRFVNDGDFIPRLPPRAWGYDHAGEVEYFDADGKRHEGEAMWQAAMAEAADSPDGFLKRNAEAPTPDGIEQYVARLT